MDKQVNNLILVVTYTALSTVFANVSRTILSAQNNSWRNQLPVK